MIVSGPILIVAPMLNRLGVCVKWMSSYLRGANVAPWVFAHLTHASWMLLRVSQFDSVLRPYARIFISSTKLITDVLRLVVLTDLRFWVMKREVFGCSCGRQRCKVFVAWLFAVGHMNVVLDMWSKSTRVACRLSSKYEARGSTL